MTHDKEDREIREDAIYKLGIEAGRAAERAEIREKLESEGVKLGLALRLTLWRDSQKRSPATELEDLSVAEQLAYVEQASAAINKILEVI